LPGNGAGDARGRSKLAGLHDRILGLFSTGEDLELPVSWWADPGVVGIRREIADFVNGRIGAGPFGFYDPRAMRLMPVWNQIAKELKLAPKIVHCLRSPAQLARVLQARDGIPPALAEYRWFARTTEFFRHARKAEICTIDYDEWFIDGANLQKLQRFLALPDEPAAPDVEAAVSAMIEQERPGSDMGTGEARQPLIRSVYRLARRAEQMPARAISCSTSQASSSAFSSCTPRLALPPRSRRRVTPRCLERALARRAAFRRSSIASRRHRSGSRTISSPRLGISTPRLRSG
jgi:hypothetical protein